MAMHHVKFKGTETGSIEVEGVDAHNLDKAPLATFVFTYRPKDFLCAQGIIPNENGTEPLQTSSARGGSPNDAPPQERKRKRGKKVPTTQGITASTIQQSRRFEMLSKKCLICKRKCSKCKPCFRLCSTAGANLLKRNLNPSHLHLYPWIQMALLTLPTVDRFLRP